METPHLDLNVPNKDSTWGMGPQRITWCEEFWNFVKNINMDAVFIVLYFSQPQCRELVQKDLNKSCIAGHEINTSNPE